MSTLHVSLERQIKLQAIKTGDKVTRFLAGAVIMELLVGEVTDTIIRCLSMDGKINLENGWTFHRQTGAEIDEDLGWDGINFSGSYLMV